MLRPKQLRKLLLREFGIELVAIVIQLMDTIRTITHMDQILPIKLLLFKHITMLLQELLQLMP